MEDSITTGSHPLRCPFCEVYQPVPSGHDSMRCPSCGGSLEGELLKTLRQLTGLPGAISRHVCECGHPQMRCLPDGCTAARAVGRRFVPSPKCVGCRCMKSEQG
jgi:hypothetical protein